MKVAEICCGSYYDAKQAALGGAKRIELNSALHLGGLTPTVSTLKLVKEDFDLEVVAMVRPRGAGFCYVEEDFRVMLAECEDLLKNGADGIAFGCLTAEAKPDEAQNARLIEVIKRYGKEAVFHRAFDCCTDPYGTAELLIRMGVDRILTSGLKPKAMDGVDVIRELQSRYGTTLQILAGSGINSGNARKIMEETGISQVHSSCKTWMEDVTTNTGQVSYSYAPAPQEQCYDVVSRELVELLVKGIRE